MHSSITALAVVPTQLGHTIACSIVLIGMVRGCLQNTSLPAFTSWNTNIYVCVCLFVCVCVYYKYRCEKWCLELCVCVCVCVCVYWCVCVCVYWCVCVCACVCVLVYWLISWLRAWGPEFNPHLGIFHLVFFFLCLLPVHSCDWVGTWHLLGCKFKVFSHATAMVQVGLRVPTPLAMRKGLSPEVLSPASLSDCQVCVTHWENLHLHFACCVCVFWRRVYIYIWGRREGMLSSYFSFPMGLSVLWISL